MKSVKSVSIEPEYTQLLGEYDNAQSVYEEAKSKEAAAKKALKNADKNASKSEKQVLKLQLTQAKHLRKAQKATVGILEVAVKQWIKTHVTEEAAATAETPKKRGPKTKIKLDITENAPKKRGRQPKTVEKVEETLVETLVEAAVEAPAPKKRGRKPKSAETATETAAETVVALAVEAAPIETALETAVETIVETPAPKKRGRQPKVVEAIIAEVADVTAPKKRGRAKAVPTVEKAAPAVEAEVEEGVAGVSAREMEIEAPATKGKGKPATEPKRPRRTSEEVAAQKASLLAASEAAVSGGDDFRVVEGVGPKVTAVLHANGITTFQNLADASYEDLKALMLSNRQYLVNPTSWARQAALAAAGKMEELAALKAELKNGQ